MKPTRVEVPREIIEAVIGDAAKELGRRLSQKGWASYAGPHEALGTITEEFWEFVGAVQSNDPQKVEAEAFDLVTASLFTIASGRAIAAAIERKG